MKKKKGIRQEEEEEEIMHINWILSLNGWRLQQLFSYDVNDALQLLQKLLNSLALHDHQGGKIFLFVIRFDYYYCTLHMFFALKDKCSTKSVWMAHKKKKKELESIPSEIGESFKRDLQISFVLIT